MNTCQLGHTVHQTRLTETTDGQMTIWDRDRYADEPPGYCPGRDDVSRTLALYGTWEPLDWSRFAGLIRPGDKVWDYGSHIGWFTRTALKRGAVIYAVDSDPENMRLLHQNCRPWLNRLHTELAWAKDAHPPAWDSLRILKADIEGAEIDAVQQAWPLIETRNVDYAFIEVSPEFADYYPQLVDGIIGCGYDADVAGKPVTGDTISDTQSNVWFTRRP